MTPSSAPVEIHPDSIAAEVEMAKTEEEMPSALAAEIAQEAMETIINIKEIPATAAPALEHETPSVAPGDSDSDDDSLVEDESMETEDHTLQERSMFPKMLKLVATLKSTKNCAVDIEPTPFGDEWLDFVDKKIMPAFMTSVACGDIDDGFLSVDDSTAVSTAVSAVSTAVSTKCESKTFEDEETLSKKYPKELVPFISCLLTLVEDKAKKAAQSLHHVDDEIQRARLIQEYIQKLMMHKDMSLVPPELMPLVQKFEALNGAATDTIFPVVAAE